MVIDIDKMLFPTQITHTATARSEAVVAIDRDSIRPCLSDTAEGTRSAPSHSSETNSAADKLHAAVAAFFAGGCF